MKNTFRNTTIGFLGAAVTATQLMGADTLGASASGTLPGAALSGAFEQAAPITPAQQEATRLLKRVSFNAAETTRHADRLESFTRGNPRLQYESHAAELNKVKTSINAMGADLQVLQALRSSALPWQQGVIDRIQPVLVDLASNATEAIERLNQERHRPHSPEYREAVQSVYALAGQTRDAIQVNLQYADAREKLNRLDAPAVEAASVEETAAVRKSLDAQVRSELLKLPYYGVFDHLAYSVDGNDVTLTGQVNWPALKSDAERAVRGIEGVETVTSKIEVLPLSPNDDRIRLNAYRAIYGHSALSRYGLNPNPPIRIIVENGKLTLMGVVDSEMDRTIAHMQANGVPGAFSVTNNLQVGS